MSKVNKVCFHWILLEHFSAAPNPAFINLLIIYHNCQFPPPVSREPSTVSREVFKIVKLTMLGRAGAERRLNRIPIEFVIQIFSRNISTENIDWGQL